jgi:hypothetical protein
MTMTKTPKKPMTPPKKRPKTKKLASTQAAAAVPVSAPVKAFEPPPPEKPPRVRRVAQRRYRPMITKAFRMFEDDIDEVEALLQGPLYRGRENASQWMRKAFANQLAEDKQQEWELLKDKRQQQRQTPELADA